jgi:pimeloyl-ACP methyl ester carboxylesterase
MLFHLTKDYYWRGLDYFFGTKVSRTWPFQWFGRLLIGVFLYRIGVLRGDNLWSHHRAAIDLVSKIAPRPILIMHGDSDEIVPVAQGEEMYREAGEPKYLWIAKGGHHCML